MTRSWTTFFASCALTAACGSSPDVCVTGETRVCNCTSTEMGVQVCVEGDRFGACRCDEPLPDGGSAGPDAGSADDLCSSTVHVPANSWHEAYDRSAPRTFTFINAGSALFHVFEGTDCDVDSGRCMQMTGFGEGVEPGFGFTATGGPFWLLTDEATGATDVCVREGSLECSSPVFMESNTWHEAHADSTPRGFTFANVGSALFHVFEGADCDVDSSGCTQLTGFGEGVDPGWSFTDTGGPYWLLTDEATGGTEVCIHRR